MIYLKIGGDKLDSGMPTEDFGFDSFFEKATRNKPYPFQKRLATYEKLPELIDIPTGLGKTDAVVLAWLWRRRFASREVREATPRRLVYCLPMRVLVEQTRDKAKMWLNNLGMLANDGAGDAHSVDGWAAGQGDKGNRIAVTVLMGGESKDDWDFYPERDAIIIGTQDMLLSRALNRGYGMSRYKWPVHFGLLNNDCLWVMDEVQLMGVGVETSAQLQAFCNAFGTFGTVQYIWMSATLGETQLTTVDHQIPVGGPSRISLEPEERTNPAVSKKFEARKPLKKASLRLDKENEKNYPREFAFLLKSVHKSGSLTLAVVNRVSRAQQIFEELLKNGRTKDNTAVLHSRFREGDRKARMMLLDEKKDRIIVATQVVEAGVDVSARTLVTELAPWPSLVQRLGRCNRRGEDDDASVLWIDIESTEGSSDFVLPYDSSTLENARSITGNLEDGGPKTLGKASESYEEPEAIRAVVRKKDFLELFDTTPDLTGNDLDVSQYIREGENKDISVYWREYPESGPSKSLRRPAREELCSVSLAEMTKYLKKFDGWIWDAFDGSWKSVNVCRPGQIILLNPKNGGYSSVRGWIGVRDTDGKAIEVILSETDGKNHSLEDETESQIGAQVLLKDHLNDVSREAIELSRRLGTIGDQASAIVTAARWHDVGKLHDAFQNMLLSGRADEENLRAVGPWAKSKSRNGRPIYWIQSDDKIEERRYFRHELASALSWIQTEGNSRKDADLIAFLIAGHHGKIRMSIRSLPGENEPQDGRLFARGVWQNDRLKQIAGILENDVMLDLSLMKMGLGSWLERMLRLRNDPTMGPLRLAFLESVLRISDWRASKKEAMGEGSE